MPASTLTTPGIGTGTAPGTCGELAQGVLPGGRRFHVTCPLEEGVRVTVELRPARRRVVRGLAAGMVKTECALLAAADLLDLGAVEIDVRHTSRLPRAKGMASSTADIVAAVRALSSAAGTTLAPQAQAQLAASIEPSDGIMWDGVVAVDHHSGELIRRWDWSPRFAIAMFVPVASRDTTWTDPAPDEPDAAHQGLLSELDLAFARRDLAAVAALSTRSAELNERLVRNPLLPTLGPAWRSAGALGLCVGHSGTVCGLLFDAERPGTELARRAVKRWLPALPPGTVGRVVRTSAPTPVTAEGQFPGAPRTLVSRQA